MRKVFGILTVIPLLSINLFSHPVSALESDSPSYTLTEYNDLVQQGALDSSISYENWAAEGAYQDNNVAMESSPNYVIQNPGSSSFTLQKGDILITNGTRSAGIAGHSGIAISSTEVLSIRGAGYTPSVMSFSTWKTKYDIDTTLQKRWTKVYRVGSSSYANEAANWAINNYKGKDYGYKITGNLLGLNPTYCSKMVWQSYARISKALVVQPTNDTNVVYPYDLDEYFIDSANLSRVAYLD